MPGQPTPPVLVEAFALNAPACTQSARVPGGKTSPFPSGSQIGIVPGAASLVDGFPPLTMLARSTGGVPPLGIDFNGILYILSAQVAAMGAGQLPVFSATLAAAMGGYALGAVLQQTADPTAHWINNVAGNATNPDTASPLGSTGWISSKPLRTTIAAGGNDLVLPGPSDYFIGVDATAGPIAITGFVPQRDGQRLTVRKIDATTNGVTLQSLTGSAVGHQLQVASGGLGIPFQYAVASIQFNSSLNAWAQI